MILPQRANPRLAQVASDNYGADHDLLSLYHMF